MVEDVSTETEAEAATVATETPAIMEEMLTEETAAEKISAEETTDTAVSEVEAAEETIAEDIDDAEDVEMEVVEKTDAEVSETVAKTEDDGDENYAEADDFENMIAEVEGDRVKVLEDEGRSPDYSDNDDTYIAETWFFEDMEGDNPVECRIYAFNESQLDGEVEVMEGACPE
ncbi:Uncharacterised protein [Candidatus Venteria ishoeyi]|uniref:Uncharacterized protein n=1 Tax=Candidatus Venteria ishoeyi TaxID=1899563 RepID=A0A1H6FDG4_9GAMM|nr:Uncharacterised protein [Candidatus Venteria ishoeyi]